MHRPTTALTVTVNLSGALDTATGFTSIASILNITGGAGNDNLQRNRELGAYPASRSFWVNLNLGF